MNIKVAAFTVSEKSINIVVVFLAQQSYPLINISLFINLRNKTMAYRIRPCCIIDKCLSCIYRKNERPEQPVQVLQVRCKCLEQKKKE